MGIEPLDFLAQCSVEEFSILEALDQDYISEQINKIDSEDLKESLEKSYINHKYVKLEDLLGSLTNFQNTKKYQQATKFNPKLASDDNFTTLNAQQTNLKETTKDLGAFLLEKDDIDKQMRLMQNNIEKSMLKSHMSCHHLCETSKMDATFDAHRKTRKLFNNVRDSRKSLKIFNEARDVAGVDFFSGKRKTLTNELEIYRNHLKRYGYDMLTPQKKFKKTLVSLSRLQ